jgi:hypothetical protein
MRWARHAAKDVLPLVIGLCGFVVAANAQSPNAVPSERKGVPPAGADSQAVDRSHPMSEPAPRSAWVIPCRTDPSDKGWCAVWFSEEVPMGTRCSCGGRQGHTEVP